MPPSGAVSSMADAASSSVSGSDAERLAGSPEVRGTIAEVAAQCDVGALPTRLRDQPSTAK